MVYKQVTDSLAFYCNVRLIFDDLQTNTKLFGFLWQCILRFIKKKQKQRKQQRTKTIYRRKESGPRGRSVYSLLC